MSFAYHSYVLACHSYITRVSFVCHSYVLVCHSHITLMYSYVILVSLVYHSCVTCMTLVFTRMSLVCTCMLSVCHSYVLLCYSYVFYYEHMSTKGRQFWQVPSLKSFILKESKFVDL